MKIPEMKNCGIIFDCDGTLVNSLSQAVDSLHYALEQVGEPRTTEQIVAHFGAGADRIIERVIGDEKKAPLASLAFQYFLEHQTELAKTTQLHNGIRVLLDQLKAAEIPMSIVTGRHEFDLDIVLAPHGLKNYFVALLADNHVPNSKPAPDGVLLAAQKMGLSPERTFYVGDAVYDIQAAQSAGCIAVAALWDAQASIAELKALSPDYLAETPNDVWSFFQERFGS